MRYCEYGIDFKWFVANGVGYDDNVAFYHESFDEHSISTGDGCIQTGDDCPGGDIDGEGESHPASYPYGDGMNSCDGDGWSEGDESDAWDCYACVSSLYRVDLDDFIIWQVKSELSS